MASLKERVSTGISDLRERRPVVDHAVRMQEHYGKVQAGQQAGAVTYFGFLSFFPILSLAFLAVGLVARVYPDAQGDLTKAIDQVLPGLVGKGDNQLDLTSMSEAKGALTVVFLVSVVGVIYAGLGWLSGMRQALETVFEVPSGAQPNFVFGKLRDLAALVSIGLVLFLSVGISGFVSAFATQILEWVHLGTQLAPLVTLLTLVLGVVASMLLFYAMFKLLADPPTPKRSLWSGALFGAIGFEVLKRLSGLLLASTKEAPAVQAFGIALILVIWINYFSRVVMYAAAWAHTTREARALRVPDGPAPVQGPVMPPLDQMAQLAGVTSGNASTPALTQPKSWLGPFAAGSALTLGLVAFVRGKRG